MARRSNRNQGRSGRASRPQTKRHYPRTARLNTLIQQIAASFVDQIDDDRLPMITVTGVEVDSDLNRAQVFVSHFDDDPSNLPTPESDLALLEVLGEYAKPMRRSIGSEARLRKTPEVEFVIDPAVRAGARVENILASLDIDQDDPENQDAPESDPRDVAE